MIAELGVVEEAEEVAEKSAGFMGGGAFESALTRPRLGGTAAALAGVACGGVGGAGCSGRSEKSFKVESGRRSRPTALRMRTPTYGRRQYKTASKRG